MTKRIKATKEKWICSKTRRMVTESHLRNRLEERFNLIWQLVKSFMTEEMEYALVLMDSNYVMLPDHNRFFFYNLYVIEEFIEQYNDLLNKFEEFKKQQECRVVSNQYKHLISDDEQQDDSEVEEVIYLE